VRAIFLERFQEKRFHFSGLMVSLSNHETRQLKCLELTF